MRPFFFLRLAVGLGQLGIFRRGLSLRGLSLRLAKRLVLLFLIFAEQAKVGVRLAELGQGVLALKIMHRLFVAFPNSNQVAWEQFLFRVTLLEVFGEVAAVPPNRPSKLVERLQQLKNLAELFLRHFFAALEAAKPHIIRAKAEQHLRHLRVVVDVLDPLFARHFVERRLGDVHETLFNQLRHLPVQKRQQ